MELADHQIIPAEEPNHYTCTVCGCTWGYIPKWKCPGVRQYNWGDTQEHLMTERQLRQKGLRLAPGQPPAGCLWYGKAKDYIWLYDVRSCEQRPPATETQLAALARAREALTCKGCGKHVTGKRWLLSGFCQSCFEVVWARECLGDPDLRVLDTETTGLESDAQIISIAILDREGAVLFNSMVRPDGPIPGDATRVNGITNEMVAGAPAWPEVYPQVLEILCGKFIITYNADFDKRMFRQTRQRYGIEETTGAKWGCLMESYKSHTQRRRWTSLSAACAEVRVPAGDHSALGDTRAAYQLLKAMAATTLSKLDASVEEDHV